VIQCDSTDALCNGCSSLTHGGISIFGVDRRTIIWRAIIFRCAQLINLGPFRRPALEGHLDRLDLARIGFEITGNATGERGELQCLQETDQRLWLRFDHAELVQLVIKRHVGFQRYQLLRYARLIGKLDQLLAAFGLLDLFCA
jgi:hypothetical protein